MTTRSKTAGRQERAEQIRITDVRRISDEVWEIDCLNDDGEVRENMTIIPSQIYSPTKDMQHRGPNGVVGKYIRALAMENFEAREKLLDAIEERTESIEKEIRQLKGEVGRLKQAESDLKRNS